MQEEFISFEEAFQKVVDTLPFDDEQSFRRKIAEFVEEQGKTIEDLTLQQQIMIDLRIANEQPIFGEVVREEPLFSDDNKLAACLANMAYSNPWTPIQMQVLDAMGYEAGRGLPEALTSPSTVFVDEGGKNVHYGSKDSYERYLKLSDVMEGNSFPLGMAQQALQGNSWINIFEKVGHHYEWEIEQQVAKGLNIRNIVADFNEMGRADKRSKVTLLHSGGNYLVEDGKHRMSYLKVLYEMAMANSELDESEKELIRATKLAVRVRDVEMECVPKLGENTYVPPAFLPKQQNFGR